ncbi:MAG: replication-relaxation family protein [Phycisphaerae bacterium]|nr:replication-relaxation family protein [Phycisphaerae bacterium]
MAFRLKRGDFRIMTAIAEHRMLTVRQLVCVLAQNAQSVHRRLRDIQDAGLVLAQQRGHGRRRGRPEKLVSLSPAGTEALRSADVLGPGVPDESVTGKGIHCINHQLLVNWVQIQLAEVGSFVPGLETQFLAAESPFLLSQKDRRALVVDSAPSGNGAKEVRFVPDGGC